MKKVFLLIILLALFPSLKAQKLYEKVPVTYVSRDIIDVSQKFSAELAKKCKAQDYSAVFQDVAISIDLRKDYSKNLKKICGDNDKNFGDIKLVKLNSVYDHKFTTDDPIRLLIFDAVPTKANKDAKYYSVWISRKTKEVQGSWISKEKPLNGFVAGSR